MVGLLTRHWRYLASLYTLIEAVEIVCIGLSPLVHSHVARIQRDKVIPFCCYKLVDVLLQQAVDALLHRIIATWADHMVITHVSKICMGSRL